METIPPLAFRWDGEAMRPARPKLADKHFVIGEDYCLEVLFARSQASHNHYFAAVKEVWKNLPDELAERFPDDEALRKYALIRTGYRDERSIVCASKAEAARVAAFVKPMDSHAVVVVSAAVVTVLTAKSQSKKAMGNEAFKASKDAVLAYLADLIDVTPAALRENAGAAA